MPRGAPKARLVTAVPEEGWVEVSSSNLASVCYFDKLEILYIRFVSGAVYSYSGVPRKVYDGLLSADSKGVYHDRHIKWVYAFSGPLAAPD